VKPRAVFFGTPDAQGNRDITQHYSFDQETIHQYPFIDSNAAARHRFVGVGSIDGPWDMTYTAKLTLATPIPNNDFVHYDYPNTAPNGANNLPIAGTPSGGGNVNNPNAIGPKKFLFGGDIFGYRTVDFSINKNFVLTETMALYLRLDILNAFNYHNYADYITNYGSNGVLNQFPVSYNKIGNITYVPREYKFTMGFRF
jgi:hypothetical protein